MLLCLKNSNGICPALNRQEFFFEMRGFYKHVKNNPYYKGTSKKIHDQSFRNQAIKELYEKFNSEVNLWEREVTLNTLPEHPFFKKLIKRKTDIGSDLLIKKQIKARRRPSQIRAYQNIPKYFEWLLEFQLANNPIKLSSETLKLHDLHENIFDVIPEGFLHLEPIITKQEIFDPESQKQIEFDIVNYTDKKVHISKKFRISINRKYLYEFHRLHPIDNPQRIYLHPKNCQMAVYEYSGRTYISWQYLSAINQNLEDHHVYIEIYEKYLVACRSQKKISRKWNDKVLSHIVKELRKIFPLEFITALDISIQKILLPPHQLFFWIKYSFKGQLYKTRCWLEKGEHFIISAK